MKQYIFGARNGIYIIDLQKTVRLFKRAYKFVQDAAATGVGVLFVGIRNRLKTQSSKKPTGAVNTMLTSVGWVVC